MKTNETMRTVIVGGQGKTGRRVAQRLAELGLPQRLASRSTALPFDWAQEPTWGPAMQGADALYLTYHPDLAMPGAAERVHSLCEVAVSAGVQNIVLLAGRGEPQVHPAEAAVRAAGVRHAILECAFFNQNFDEGVARPVDGNVYFPAGSVTEPFIDCDDIAACAVEALINPAHDGQTYELTGPELLTFDQAVRAMANASERPLHYVPVSFEQYAELLGEHFSPPEVDFLTGLFRFLLDGHNSHVTDGVERLLGRPARTFAEYAQATAEAWR